MSTGHPVHDDGDDDDDDDNNDNDNDDGDDDDKKEGGDKRWTPSCGTSTPPFRVHVYQAILAIKLS